MVVVRVMEYKVVRSKRKTLGIQLKDGQIIVRAPYGVSERIINDIVIQKEDWINKRINSIKEYGFLLEDRSTILVKGELLEITLGEYNSILVEGNKLCLPNDITVERLEKWFRVQAEKVIIKRFKLLSTEYHFKNVRLSNARTRYGSCNNKGNLNLAWRLIFCPEYVIDYVIIHELEHLNHLNHSKFFWSAVEKKMPNYKMAKKWLKENNVMSLF